MSREDFDKLEKLLPGDDVMVRGVLPWGMAFRALPYYPPDTERGAFRVATAVSDELRADFHGDRCFARGKNGAELIKAVQDKWDKEIGWMWNDYDPDWRAKL